MTTWEVKVQGLPSSIEETKGDTSFDHYGVRTWPSRYRHITLTMLAYAWLFNCRKRAAQPSRWSS